MRYARDRQLPPRRQRWLFSIPQTREKRVRVSSSRLKEENIEKDI
jgi:hypothetical protein